MSNRIIMRVRGQPIFWDGQKITFTAGMTIDADGSPHAYHPDGSPPGLDYLGNAGHTGNWWAICTHNKKKNGIPITQTQEDPAPGFYISMTSLVRSKYKYADPRRYIDSEEVPFVVIPSPLLHMVAPIFLGCKALAVNQENGKSCNAVLADIGPATHLGEGSMALAKALGIPSSPKNGGTEQRVISYTLWPGVPAVVNGETFTLQPS